MKRNVFWKVVGSVLLGVSSCGLAIPLLWADDGGKAEEYKEYMHRRDMLQIAVYNDDKAGIKYWGKLVADMEKWMAN